MFAEGVGRFEGWEVGRFLAKHKLYTDADLLEKAYGYVKEYYW
jgi:hypothetical protein